MTQTKDEHIGETINIYTILYLCDRKSNDGHKLYHIQCEECGWENDIQYRNIKNLSPVCNHITNGGVYVNFNGRVRWTNKRLQRIFRGMCRRCYDETDKDYNTYGGKGVRVCTEWLHEPLQFKQWAFTHGYKDDLTIDRIDSDGDYCPENCRWITLEENSKYKSTTSLINVNGEVHTGNDWAKKLGIGTNRINTYIRIYGLENTIKFIKKYMENPHKKPKTKQSYYDLYMTDNSQNDVIV